MRVLTNAPRLPESGGRKSRAGRMVGGCMETRARLLVVDDNRALLRTLQISLSAAGYAVTCADNGADALSIFHEQHPDLIILDVMMPDMNGWQVCQHIREISEVPILMLTAMREPEYRIRGLSMGADDYLSKPFEQQELLLRIANILKHVGFGGSGAQGRPSTRYDDGHLVLDLETHVFTFEGRPLHFTPQELNLLACFVRQQNQVLTHEYLLYRVWGISSGAHGEAYVKTYVRYLRLKIEPNPRRPIYFVNEHGIGYRLAHPQRDGQEKAQAEGAKAAETADAAEAVEAADAADELEAEEA